MPVGSSDGSHYESMFDFISKEGIKVDTGQPVERPPVSPKEDPNFPSSIPAEGRALLKTIYNSESPGYNVMYGGGTFSSYEDHPNVPNRIKEGPNAGLVSTAAGAPQFLYRTWVQQRDKLGLTDFSPQSQNIAAWDLAQTNYQRSTGRELLSDLKDTSQHNNIARVLSATWTSLPGGIETNKAGRNFTAVLNKHLTGLSDGPETGDTVKTYPGKEYKEGDVIPGKDSYGQQTLGRRHREYSPEILDGVKLPSLKPKEDGDILELEYDPGNLKTPVIHPNTLGGDVELSSVRRFDLSSPPNSTKKPVIKNPIGSSRRPL